MQILPPRKPSFGAAFYADRGRRMPLEKPTAVAADPVKSAKWDELDSFGEQTAYQNDMGNLKSFPQIATLKTASAEIRQLNKQLDSLITS